jgi:pimeloyl-CoA synthetase
MHTQLTRYDIEHEYANACILNVAIEDIPAQTERLFQLWIKAQECNWDPEDEDGAEYTDTQEGYDSFLCDLLITPCHNPDTKQNRVKRY